MAFIDPDRPDTHFLTLADYRLLSKRIALGLLDAGLQPGQRVLLYSGNNVYFPTVFCGILMAGGVFTGASPAFTRGELVHQLRDSGASFLIASEAGLPTALSAAVDVGLPRRQIFIFDSMTTAKSNTPSPGKAGRRDGVRHWTELLAGNLAQAEAWDWIEPADPAEAMCCLNYSSGTTGLPKGVQTSHAAYVATVVGMVAGEEKENITDQRSLCILPLYHVLGQAFFSAVTVYLGIPVYIMASFDFEKMLQHTQRFRISMLMCVPPILVALVKHPAAKKYNLSSMTKLFCGGAPAGSELLNEVEQLWPSGMALVRQGWGMTELTCCALFWHPKDTRKSGGVGEVAPNCSARLMELDGKTSITEANRPGELWLAGPVLMKGYWQNPAATAETIVVDDDGTLWLKTGDIAYVDNYGPGGVFHIVDRLKELIKVKGFQVAPAELEAILLERADIVDAAVVGVVINGEELPRAYVVRAPGSNTTGREIAAWMEDRVAGYKHLRGGVALIDAIPRSPAGKIMRKILRERAAFEVGDRQPPRSSRLS